jgi:hypothetical protein
LIPFLKILRQCSIEKWIDRALGMSVKHQTKDLYTTKGSYNDNAHLDQDSKLHHEQYPHMYYPLSLTCANFQSGIHESRSNCRVFVSTCQNIFHPLDWHFALKIGTLCPCCGSGGRLANSRCNCCWTPRSN